MEKIKNALKSAIYSVLPHNSVIFESAPDYSDNTRAVFDEMVRRKLNEKYKLVWLSYDGTGDFPEKIKNVITVKWESFGVRKYLYSAKAIISCNRMVKPSCKKQFSIYLDHGTPLKNVGGFEGLPESIRYYLSSSEGTADVRCEVLHISDKSKVVSLGFPRNDAFIAPKKDIRAILKTNCKKIIVWYPTFRQHKSKDRADSGNALPIIYNEEWAKALNNELAKNDVLIVLKPHFAQDVSYIKKLSLSNIVFIDDEFYKANGITSYEFLNATDALITDYSSVYYDYLLVGNPIALIWEDIEEYKKNPGLIEGYEEICSGAEKIYNLPDFVRFIENVASGADSLSEKRKGVCKWAHFSDDGQNSRRVVDFIIEKAQL